MAKQQMKKQTLTYREGFNPGSSTSSNGTQQMKKQTLTYREGFNNAAREREQRANEQRINSLQRDESLGPYNRVFGQSVATSQRQAQERRENERRELSQSLRPYDSVFGQSAATSQRQTQERRENERREFSQSFQSPQFGQDTTISNTTANSTPAIPSEDDGGIDPLLPYNVGMDAIEFLRGTGSALLRDLPGKQPGEDFEISEDNLVAPSAQGVLRAWADFGSMVPNVGNGDPTKSELGKALYGEETKELGNIKAGQEFYGDISRLFGDEDAITRQEESTGIKRLGYGSLGFGLGLAEVFGVGLGKNTGKYAIKYGDDVLDNIFAAIKGNADKFVKAEKASETKDILRGLTRINLDDDKIDALAKSLTKSDNLDDVVKNTDRYEGISRATNDVERIVKSSDKDIEDLVNAKNVDEVEEILTRTGNDLNRLYHAKNADDVKKALIRSNSEEDVIKSLMKGARDSLAERRFNSRIKKAYPELENVSGQRIIRSTDDLYKQARREAVEDLDGTIKKAKEGTDDKAVARAYASIDELSQGAKNETNTATKSKMLDEAAELANETAEKLTDMGRGLQAAGAMARLSPAGVLRSIQKRIAKYNKNVPMGSKKAKLTTKETEFILNETKEIISMAEGVERTRRYQNLQKYISKFTPDSWFERLNAYWRASLLTSLDTMGLNLSANTGHFAAELLKDAPATFLDSILASMAKSSNKVLGTSFDTARSKAMALPSRKSFAEGYTKGKDYLVTGFDERKIAQKFDKKSVSFGSGKTARLFQEYTDGVFRVMGAADQPFYYGALDMSLRGQARVKAINKGLKGTKKKEFIKNLVENPTEEMLRYGTADASTAVFQNKTKLGEALRDIRKAPGGKWAIPFANTPAAVATQIAKYSPAGVLYEMASQAISGKTSRKALVEAFGRSSVGTSPMIVGYAMYDKGGISLNYPEDQREAELAQAAGRGFNSIKIGNRWYEAESFGPAGSLMLIGAHLKRNEKESGSPSKAMQSSILNYLDQVAEGGADALDVLLDSSPLPTMIDSVNVISDPKRFGKEYLGRLVSGFNPNLVQDFAEATDPYERKVTSDSGGIAANVFEEITEQIKKGIPGVRQQLQPKVDVLGDVKESQGIWGFINPIRNEISKESVVIDELARLQEEGFRVSPTRIGGSKGYKSLKDSSNVNLVNLTGTMIREGISNINSKSDYEELEDEEKAEMINDEIRYAKILGRAFTAVEEIMDIETEEEMGAKIEAMKEDNVLTEDVLPVFLDLGGEQLIENVLE